MFEKKEIDLEKPKLDKNYYPYRFEIKNGKPEDEVGVP